MPPVVTIYQKISVILPCSYCEDKLYATCNGRARKHLNGFRCCKCKTVKPTSDFDANRSRPDKLHPECKECIGKRGPRGKNRKTLLEKKQKKLLSKMQKLYNILKAGAKSRYLTISITFEEFAAIITKPCYYCGLFSHDKDYCGIDRVDNLKGYEKENCVSCCAYCNKMKSNLNVAAFLSHIAAIYNKQNQ